MADQGKGYALPVYRTWPDKPYEVIGSIRHKVGYRSWNASGVKTVTKVAKKKGGDAVVIRTGAEFGVSGVVGQEKQAGTWSRQTMTGLVIRWLSAEEIKRHDEEALKAAGDLAALWQDWEFRHPSARIGSDVHGIVQNYLAMSGVSPASPAFLKQAERILDRISSRPGEGFAGDWICKAHMRSGGLASSTERDYFGIVQVEQSGQRVTVVSREGNVELTFNGVVNEGGVEGDLAVAGVAARAVGVATDSKISVTFLATLPNGSAQGNVSIQRAALKP